MIESIPSLPELDRVPEEEQIDLEGRQLFVGGCHPDLSEGKRGS